METYSSILAWEIPWTEESLGLQESDTTEWLYHIIYLNKIYLKHYHFIM